MLPQDGPWSVRGESIVGLLQQSSGFDGGGGGGGIHGVGNPVRPQTQVPLIL